MKKITKLSMLAVGAAMVTQALQAQIDTGFSSDGDLVLGFTSQAAGVTSDYVLDLGAVPSAANTQLGGITLTAYNSAFGAAATAGTVNVGVMGADNNNDDVFTSTLRAGAAATTAGSGTEAHPQSDSDNQIDQAAGFDQLSLGTVLSSSTSSFTYNVAKSPTAFGTAVNSFTSYLAHSGNGANPLVTLPGSESITLDLWNNTDNGNGIEAWTYAGDLSINASGSTLSAVFDPTVPVPEPSTYGLLASFGLLALGFRNQLSRKNA